MAKIYLQSNMQTWNPGIDNIHSEILGLLVEINQHLLCFMAQGVPREDEDINFHFLANPFSQKTPSVKKGTNITPFFKHVDNIMSWKTFKNLCSLLNSSTLCINFM